MRASWLRLPLLLLLGATFALAQEPPKVDIDAEIARLGARKYKVRAEATERLRSAGLAALPALRKAAQHRDPEVRRRATQLVLELSERILDRAGEAINQAALETRRGELLAARKRLLVPIETLSLQPAGPRRDELLEIGLDRLSQLAWGFDERGRALEAGPCFELIGRACARIELESAVTANHLLGRAWSRLLLARWQGCREDLDAAAKLLARERGPEAVRERGWLHFRRSLLEYRLARWGAAERALELTQADLGNDLRVPTGARLAIELHRIELLLARGQTEAADLALARLRKRIQDEGEHSEPIAAYAMLTEARRALASGELARAAQRAAAGVALMVERHGAEHSELAFFYLAQATTLRRQGEPKRARLLAMRAANLLRKGFGPEHPDVGHAELELAHHQPDARAAATLRGALARWQKTFGRDHPALVAPLEQLAARLPADAWLERGQLRQRAARIRGRRDR